MSSKELLQADDDESIEIDSAHKHPRIGMIQGRISQRIAD